MKPDRSEEIFQDAIDDIIGNGRRSERAAIRATPIELFTTDTRTENEKRECLQAVDCLCDSCFGFGANTSASRAQRVPRKRDARPMIRQLRALKRALRRAFRMRD